MQLFVIVNVYTVNQIALLRGNGFIFRKIL
jgi:hypothetical protein